MNPWAKAKALLLERQRRQARNSLAVYAGLHIPAEIERDDLPALHELPIAARYIPAEHHRLLIEKLEAVERGEIKRLLVAMPPGSAKSSYASMIFPAWYLGRHPEQSIIAASQTQELADRFGRRARNLVASRIHGDVFGSGLAPDQRAAGHWETAVGGEYHATGVQPFAGRRGDGVICDDLLRGRKDADSKTVRNSVWEWYLSDIRPRLKPSAWIVMIGTRWHEDDVAGRILPPESIGKSGWVTAKDGEQWYVLSLAAVIETAEERDNDPLGREIGDILWPGWFTPEMLEQERKTQGRRNWSALYQQKPRPNEGAILKRADWRRWPHEKPPKCEYVVSVYDTAFEEGEENDYTARTTWGVFWHEEERPAEIQALQAKLGKPLVSGRYCCVLLERFKDRVEFPKLRELAVRHYKEFKPDRVLIEKKASGHSLIQELRRARVPVSPLKADRSKLARAHAASAVLESGCVFYMPRKWADEVMDECEAFPAGEHDDIVDTCVHAWIWLRRTFHLQLRDEQDEDDEDAAETTKRRLYG